MIKPLFSRREHDYDDEKKPFYRRTRFWWGVLIALILLILVRHCSNNTNGNKHSPAISVIVTQAKTANVPIYLQGLGTVTPFYSVIVRTQINGQLLQVNFKEGQMVKKGDLLAQIDPRPYEAQLVQYQGQLTRDQALLANAEIDLKRYQTLWKQDSVAKQTLDTQTSVVKQNLGSVQVDEGLIQNTKLNLYYTRIIAPIAGRIGLRLVDPGNYVQISDTSGIAVIAMVNPITVIFTLPEDDVQKVLQQINAGKILSVQAYDRTQTQLLASGELQTMDNQIDPTTGTVKLRAKFKNDKNILFPNQFVNIKLLVTTLQNAVTVPTAAIQHGAQGTFVYLVNTEKNTVSVQPVIVGVTNEDVTTVTSGLQLGQTVVIEGTDKLTDGSKLEISKPEDENKIPKKSPGIIHAFFGSLYRRLLA